MKHSEQNVFLSILLICLIILVVILSSFTYGDSFKGFATVGASSVAIIITLVLLSQRKIKDE